VLARLAAAGALTGAIGLERELRERAAGLRTHMLVGIGSALFTIVSAYGWREFRFSAAEGVVFDPTRIAAQIVTGVGFLGAGAIIRQGLSVRGLTTAAGLWVVAAIGMAAGAGYYSAAVLATGIVLVGLGPFRWFEGGAIARLRRAGRTIELALGREGSVSQVLRVVNDRKVRIDGIELEGRDHERRLRVELDVPAGRAGFDLVEELAALEGVRAVKWHE
jgi:putative Mg2+ transporter-C (MgtC) family protein